MPQYQLEVDFNTDKNPSDASLSVEAKALYSMPKSSQLLKWVGNKQTFAPFITSHFDEFNTYFEPFLGSAAVLGHLAPREAVASDAYKPLIEIWEMLSKSPQTVIKWYSDRYQILEDHGHREGYELIKANFNKSPNAADLLFISRSCYGGVIRFRKHDGYLSTPCGIHKPIKPEKFAMRAKLWNERIANVDFRVMDYSEAIDLAKEGDLVYCDPPYIHSQAILYGGQNFIFSDLINSLELAVSRGVKVALSIDGTKKSGNDQCKVEIPKGLFPRELFVPLGASMLKRFQRSGQDCLDEHVQDRLLLSW